MNPYVGKTFTFKDCAARTCDNNRPVLITGSYTVEAYEPEDRSVGIFGSDYVLVPEGTPEGFDAWESIAVYAAEWDFIQQVDPERVAREKADEEKWEREAAEAAQ